MGRRPNPLPRETVGLGASRVQQTTIAHQQKGRIPRFSAGSTRTILVVAALALSLSGCNAIGGAFSSVKGAVFPRGDEAGSGRTTQTAQAAAAPAPASPPRTQLGEGSNTDRLEALEDEVTALREELEQLKPSIERLVGIESDIRVLLTQLSRLTDTGAAPVANAAAPQQENQEAAAPAAAPAAQPPALRPVEQAAPQQQPAGQPQSLRPIQAPAQPAAAPAAAPAAPTQLTAISPSVAPAEQVSVHLASFRQVDAARQGWRELQAAHSDLLGGLDYRISEVQLSGGRGTFYRVKAGPFTDVASAEEVCNLMKARNAYCVLSDFTGTQ
jgi:hypothetical protein